MEILTLIIDFFTDKTYFKLKKQKMGKYLILFFTILILIIIASFYNFFQEKNKIKQVMVEVEKNPMLYISQKLSDNKGRNKKFMQDSSNFLINTLNPDNNKNLKKEKHLPRKDILSILKKQYKILKSKFLETNNPNIKDNFDFPIIMYATMFNDVEMIRKLLKLDIDLKTDKIEQGVLFLSIANSLFNDTKDGEEKNIFDKNNREILELLIENNVNIHADSFEV